MACAVFQYPRTGSNLCRAERFDTAKIIISLSVPSNRVEPLPPPVAKIFLTSFDTFQPGKAFFRASGEAEMKDLPRSSITNKRGCSQVSFCAKSGGSCERQPGPLIALSTVFYSIAAGYPPAILALPMISERASCEVPPGLAQKNALCGITTVAFLENVVAEATKLAAYTDGLTIWWRR